MWKSTEDIIKGGESINVEFKPALYHNYLTNATGIGIKAIIAKAIGGFLNREGGVLLIGVDDKGNVRGLDGDFQWATNKSPKDYFQQEYRQMLNHFFHRSIISKVHGKFEIVNGKDVFIVTVEPSRRKPIFVKGRYDEEKKQHEKIFYVRDGSSTECYIDIEEIVDYCIDHWNKLWVDLLVAIVWLHITFVVDVHLLKQSLKCVTKMSSFISFRIPWAVGTETTGQELNP